MKKVLISLALAAVVLSFATVAAYAGGDKVHGERGQGGVHQVCVEPGDCPWE